MEPRLPILYQYADVQHLQPYFAELDYTVTLVQDWATRLRWKYRQLVCCVVDDGSGVTYLKMTIGLGKYTFIMDKGVPPSVMGQNGKLVAVLDLSDPDAAFEKILGLLCN